MAEGEGRLVEARDIRALYVFLAMRDDTQDGDAAVVDALRQDNLTWFTHVLLNVTSWQKSPDAVDNPLVRHAVNLCKSAEVEVVWGRWLWVAWSYDQQRYANAHTDPAFYANALARVKEETKRLGAYGSLLDVEAYGASPQKTAIKRRDLRDTEREIIEGAVARAVAAAGRVDFIFPTASTRPGSFVWPLTGLGVNRCDPKSYYSTAPGYKVNARHPTSHVHRIHLWGSHVKPASSAESDRRLTPDQVKAIDLDVVRESYPECIGQWVYVPPGDLSETLKTWGPA